MEWEISLGVDPAAGSDEETETSELQSLLKDIRHIISSLYNISIAIRNPVPRESLAEFAAIDVSHFKPWDIDYIRHKFPGAPEYLIQRLGEANCKRRQLLRYYKNYHDKIARYIDPPLPSNEAACPSASAKINQVANDIRDEGDIIPCFKSPAVVSTTPQPQTTVAAIRPEAIALAELESDSDHLSQTSSTTDQCIDIQVPPPPNLDAAIDGKPFQCPYCYQVIKIDDLRSWR